MKRLKKEKPQIKKANQRQFWIEFIQMYKEKPVLWSKSFEHIDSDVKRFAYKDLVEKLKEFNDKADIDMVKSKLNSFRACLRRETRKMREAANSGKKYDPSWWCYEHIKFLNEHYDQGRAKKEPHSNACDEELEFLADDDYTITEPTTPRTKPIESAISPKRPKFESLSTPIHSEAPVEPADQQQQQHVSLEQCDSTTNWNNFELDIVCKGWALQYRDLTKQQKLFAKKAIDDILFEAQMATLHRNSVKINEDQRCLHCGSKS